MFDAGYLIPQVSDQCFSRARLSRSGRPFDDDSVLGLDCSFELVPVVRRNEAFQVGRFPNIASSGLDPALHVKTRPYAFSSATHAQKSFIAQSVPTALKI